MGWDEDIPLDLESGSEEVFGERLHGEMNTLDHLEPIEFILSCDFGESLEHLFLDSRIRNCRLESRDIGRRDTLAGSLLDETGSVDWVKDGYCDNGRSGRISMNQ